MRTLVTGGAGFIGSTLVDRLLAEGHDVDVVDDLSTGSMANLADARRDRSGPLHIHQHDLREPSTVDLIARRRPDVLFHLAGGHDPSSGLDRPVGDAQLGLVAGLHVLEGARAAGTAKVVVAASAVALYAGAREDDLPLRESSPLCPTSPAGVVARALLDDLGVYRDHYQLEFTALLLATVYGGRQRPGAGVVASFAERLLAGERCTIEGTPSDTRDLVFVDDVVDALVRAIDRGNGLRLHIGTGVETSIGELYKLMATAVGPHPEPRTAARRPGAPARNVLDVTRASIHLGWQSWTTLGEGVAALLRQLRNG